MATIGRRSSTGASAVHRSVLGPVFRAETSDPLPMSFLRRITLVVSGWLLLTRRRTRLVGDAGMTTAEYAVGTVAAVAFAVVLFKIVRSAAVSSALSSIVVSALHAI